MSDVIEEAVSSRSRCRECRKPIEEGDLRFGSDTSGLYGDSDSYTWYHLRCASRRLPDRLLATLKTIKKQSAVDDYDALVAACSTNVTKGQSVFPYGERAPTARARCVQCDQPIAKGELRVAVEREIVTGAFTRMGAGYLHPRCAMAYVGDPSLGALLASNSAMLSKADREALAKECAAGSPAPHGKSGTTAKKTNAEPATTPKPRVNQGAELVFADALLEKGDVRGELIMLESQLASISAGDPRYWAMEKRAAEILPEATKAWRKEIGRAAFRLERGLPSLRLKLSPKAKIPEEPWLGALDVEYFGAPKNAEGALASLIQQKTFSRIRRLAVRGVNFTWDGFHGFCSCEEIKDLESLDLQINLGPRGLHMLLGSTRFERLTELAVDTRFSVDADARGFEGAAGLRALRSLKLGMGVSGEIIERLIRSPLGQRLEALAVRNATALQKASLPRLRRLALGGFVSDASLEAIARNPSLGALEVLDLKNAFFEPDAALVFADRAVMPSLQGLDVSAGVQQRAKRTVRLVTIETLRARFGDGFLARGVEIAKPMKKRKPSRARR